MDEPKERIYKIPKNYSTPGKWKTFYIVNLIQGIAVFALTWLIVSRIPRLKFIFKAFLIIGIGGGLGAVFIAGINGRPLTQFIMDYLKFIFKYKRYHYEDVEDIYGEANTDSTDSTGAYKRESKLDKLIKRKGRR